MRAAFTLGVVAACGRIDFVPLADAGLAADAPVQSHVLYVATRAPDQLAAFAIAGDGSLAALAQVASPTPTANAVAVDPQNAFVFVAGSGIPALAAFALDPATRAPVAQVAAFDNTPYTSFSPGLAAVTVEPSGRNVYVGDSNGKNLALALDRATGAVAFLNAQPVAATATSSVVDMHDRWLVTPNAGTSCSLVVQAIDPGTGTLGPQAIYTPVACLADAEHAALDATDQHVYIAEAGNCALYGYPIDPAIGVIDTANPVAGSGQLQGNDCFLDVEIHPNGTWMFAAGSGVIVVGVDPATGAIGARAGPGPNTVADPSIDRIAITSDGAYLYGVSAPSGNLIYGYTIDAATGALAPAPGSPYTTAGKIVDVAISR